MTADPMPLAWRYFTSYTGIKLPLKLVGGLEDGEVNNRNTFIRARFDDADRLVLCEKVVYGAVEMRHAYRYHPSGCLAEAEIVMLDGDPVVRRFAEDGTPVESGEDED